MQALHDSSTGPRCASAPVVAPDGDARLALAHMRDLDQTLGATLLDRLPTSVAAGVTLTAAFGLVCLVAAAPLLPLCALGAIITAFTAIVAVTSHARRTHAVDPFEILDPALAAIYRRLLCAHGELATALSVRGSPGNALLLARSRDTIADCGRAARAANAASHYVATHDRTAVIAHANQLRDEAAASGGATAEALRAAADACMEQAAALDDLAAMRARVRARLELAAASLQALTARVITQHAFDDADLAALGSHDGRELTDHLDGLAAADATCAE